MNQSIDMEGMSFDQKISQIQHLIENEDYQTAAKATDSLLEKIEKNGTARERAITYLLRARCLMVDDKDVEQAFSNFIKSAELSKQADLWDVFGEAKLMLGMIEITKGEFLEAVTHWAHAIKKLYSNANALPLLDSFRNCLENFVKFFKFDNEIQPIWCATVIDLGNAYLSLAQNEKALRLGELALQNSSEDLDLLNANELVGMAAIMSGIPVKAIEYLEKALSITKKIDDSSKSQAILLQNVAKAYKQTGEFKKAIANLEYSEILIRKEKVRKIDEILLHVNNLIEIASVHREMGNSASARPYLDKALNLIESLSHDKPDTVVIHASALTNLGLLESDEENYMEAVKIQTAAHRILSDVDFLYPPSMAQVEENLAIALFGVGQLDEAEKHWKESLKWHEQMGNLPRRLVILFALANLELSRKDYDNALALLKQALNVAENFGSKEAYAQVLFNLAKLYRIIGEKDQALEMSEKAIDIFGSLHKPEQLAFVLSEAADIYTEIENFDKAQSLRQEAAKSWRQVGAQRAADMEELKRIEILYSLGRMDLILDSIGILDRILEGSPQSDFALYIKALILSSEGQLKEAIKYLDQAIDMFQETEIYDQKIIMLIERGRILAKLNRIEEASASFKSCVALMEKIPDMTIRGNLWRSIAYYFENSVDNLTEASICLHYALECFRRKNALQKIAETNKALGYIYFQVEDYQKSANYLTDAILFFADTNQTKNLLDCQWNLGLVYLNAQVLDTAIKILKSAATLASQEKRPDKQMEVLFHLFEALRQKQDFSTAKATLMHIENFVQDKNESSIQERLRIASALLKLSEGDDLSQSEWSNLFALSSLSDQKLKIKKLLDEKTKDENESKLLNLLRNVLYNLKSENERTVLDSSLLAERHSVAVWEHGLSSKFGWKRQNQRDSEIELMTSPEFPGKKQVDDPNLKAIGELVSLYHDLGVWEDPNLAIFTPIIQKYTYNTRFRGETLVNPLALAEGCLHIFFFRSDPKRRLTRFLDNCVYTSSGKVIFCSLPFLEQLSSYMTMGEKFTRSLSEKIGGDVGDQIIKHINTSFYRFLIEWIIAHEIGHAELVHLCPFLTRSRLPREYEEAADDFFVMHIPDEGKAGRLYISLCSFISKTYHYHYMQEFGHEFTGSGMVTLEAPIHLKDTQTPHPPFLIRLLNVAERMLLRFPNLDTTGYIDKVRMNIKFEGE